MKKNLFIACICCFLMMFLCSCGNAEGIEAKNAEKVSEINTNTEVDQTVGKETLEAANEELLLNGQSEDSEFLSVSTDMTYKYLSKYELESVINMEKIVEFDWDNWATEMSKACGGKPSKEELLEMIQTEFDWNKLSIGQVSDIEKYSTLMDQFFELYNYRTYLFTEEVKDMFCEGRSKVLEKAGISQEEWQEFRNVFESFQIASSENWNVYSEDKDLAWDEYETVVNAAWNEYDSQKTALWNEYSATKEEIADKYEEEMNKLRQSYFETKDVDQYESGKKALLTAKEDELDKAWENYDTQVNGNEEVESLYSKYKAKKDAAQEEYSKKEDGLEEIRTEAENKAFEIVESHAVYKKIYDISDTDIWTELLIIIGYS